MSPSIVHERAQHSYPGRSLDYRVASVSIVHISFFEINICNLEAIAFEASDIRDYDIIHWCPSDYLSHVSSYMVNWRFSKVGIA
jgi:hypothetical protein